MQRKKLIATHQRTGDFSICFNVRILLFGRALFAHKSITNSQLHKHTNVINIHSACIFCNKSLFINEFQFTLKREISLAHMPSMLVLQHKMASSCTHTRTKDSNTCWNSPFDNGWCLRVARGKKNAQKHVHTLNAHILRFIPSDKYAMYAERFKQETFYHLR